MNRDMKTISTGFLAGFLVAINRMDRLTCYICDSVIHKVMAACLRCEEWEKSLSLFRELCPGTDLGVLDQAATGFLWWKLSRSEIEAHRIIICRGFVQLPPGRLFVANLVHQFFCSNENTGGFFEAQKWEAALQTFLEVSGAEDEVVEDC